MMRPPTLFLTVGLPCTGKPLLLGTSRSSREHFVYEGRMGEGSLRTKSAIGQDVIEGRLIQIGLRALGLGNNVVIDYGLGVETSAPLYGRQQQT